VIGMSGGLDSAVVGALCARTEVPVLAVVLPYGRNMLETGSYGRAMGMIEKFGWESLVFDIAPACHALMEGAPLAERPLPGFYKKATSQNIRAAQINLRARVRTVKLREIAQLTDYLLLGTDNLTELLLGYFTKDGNGCDVRPCKLLTKGEMYELAQIIGVTDDIIGAEPSAELEAGQTDEEGLGFSYLSADMLLESGSSGDGETDEQIRRLIAATRHKRQEPLCYTG